jgi:hypothetical protein
MARAQRIDESHPSRENRQVASLQHVGLWRSLGARFHGMEEVVGSIPTRSTNQLNHLDRTNVQKQSVCVVVCVITCHFAAFGECFHRCALGFHADLAVPLQHLAADVSGNRQGTPP